MPAVLSSFLLIFDKQITTVFFFSVVPQEEKKKTSSESDKQSQAVSRICVAPCNAALPLAAPSPVLCNPTTLHHLMSCSSSPVANDISFCCVNGSKKGGYRSAVTKNQVLNRGAFYHKQRRKRKTLSAMTAWGKLAKQPDDTVLGFLWNSRTI
jgi:hypothetical protein